MLLILLSKSISFHGHTGSVVISNGSSCSECMKVASGYVPECVCPLLLPVCLCIIASAFTPLGFAESLSRAHWWIMRLLRPQPTTEHRLLVQHSWTGPGLFLPRRPPPAGGTRAFHSSLYWTSSAENFCLSAFKTAMSNVRLRLQTSFTVKATCTLHLGWWFNFNWNFFLMCFYLSPIFIRYWC